MIQNSVHICQLDGDSWSVTGWWHNQWRMLENMELGTSPLAPISALPARVPGAVQCDLIRAGVIPSPYHSLDSVLSEWVENRDWMYEKNFVLPENFLLQRLYLHFEGLDQRGEIYLNGHMISKFDGMFLPISLDITGIVCQGENHLRVFFEPPPEIDGQYGYTSQIQHIKSRFGYIWDWCPRINPIGIWKSVYLKTCGPVEILDFFPNAQVEDKGQTTYVDAQVKLAAATSGIYQIEYVISENGQQKVQMCFYETLLATTNVLNHRIALTDVNLWWPQHMGSPCLYDITLQVKKENEISDSCQKRIGFRSVELISNPGSPENALPYTIRINGKPVFLRGVNWTPLSAYYGDVPYELYKAALQSFCEMNCNVLRVWGGAILETETFYDLCDEMGLMVWQEFPQSSSGLDNTPSDSPEFLDALKNVATEYLESKRHHPCHVLWCGGNELMWQRFVPVNDSHINIEILKNLCQTLDSGKPFFPASASGPVFIAKAANFGKEIHHDVHGPWNYEGPIAHYSYFNTDDALLRSETGCPGISRLETLEAFQGNYSLWPPDASNPLWVHRGGWWIQMEQMTQLFGQWANDGTEMGTYAKCSRFLQAEALRYAAQATRRRAPRASGFLVWMGTEPFPNNSNTSVIEWDGTAKPAFFALSRAFAPKTVSLRYNKLFYESGETFTADVFYHNDFSSENVETIRVRIFDIAGNVLSQFQFDAKTSGLVGSIHWETTELASNVFIVRVWLNLANPPVDEYVFTLKDEFPLASLRSLPKQKLDLEHKEDFWILSNTSNTTAIGVFLYGKDASKQIRPDRNYLTLLPFEQVRLQISTCSDHLTGDDIIVETL